MDKRASRRAAFLAGGMLLLCLGIGPAWGVTYDIQKELALYGWLDQHDVPGIGAVACGPTAAVNSFVYLQNKYPGIYDALLVPPQGADLDNDDDVDFYDDMIAVAQTLAAPAYMNTLAPDGTYHDDFIWGKRLYIEDTVPGRTKYLAQDYWTWSDPLRPQPAWVASMVPTWDFLYSELAHCEDVEMLLTWEDGGHYVTVTSFHWDDANDNGIIEQTEDAWIDYVDAATGAWGKTEIWEALVNEEWRIETAYVSGSWISMVVSESPVPEPLSFVFFGTGIAGVAGFVVRRKMRPDAGYPSQEAKP